jgi:EAL and modified HD-GYP domain-containing signal transduction protein
MPTLLAEPAVPAAVTEHVLLGRQPIVDSDGRMFAFELLFRGRWDLKSPHHHLAATSAVLRHVFAELGVEQALGPYRGFVNCDAAMLLVDDILELLPPDRVVIEVLESVQPTPEILARLRTLKAAGFLLALDDYNGRDARYPELLRVVDFIKLELPRIAPSSLKSVVDDLRQFPGRVIAEKVERRTQAEQCRAAGLNLFQGYFFAEPVIVKGRKLEGAQLALLRLLELLLSDAETSKVVDEFKRQPAPSLNLLRIANSAAMSLASPVHSIAHAMVVLGRRHLLRWVQLLLYTDASRPGPANPLLQAAATRGRLMEAIAQDLWREASEQADYAFMVGMLSLLPALLGVSFDEILPALRLPDRVKGALMSRDGPLGDLLSRVESLEAAPGEHHRLPQGMDAHAFSVRLVAAMAWANRIE